MKGTVCAFSFLLKSPPVGPYIYIALLVVCMADVSSISLLSHIHTFAHTKHDIDLWVSPQFHIRNSFVITQTQTEQFLGQNFQNRRNVKFGTKLNLIRHKSNTENAFSTIFSNKILNCLFTMHMVISLLFYSILFSSLFSFFFTLSVSVPFHFLSFHFVDDTF